MKFICQTLFDITATGTTGHPKTAQWPCQDRIGATISCVATWNLSRNRQRNWETLQQIIGLRTQISAITDPVTDASGTRWMFEFDTDTAGAFGSDSDSTAVLRTDADGVPMLSLMQDTPMDTCLRTHGPRQNIWFAPISINN